MVSPPFHPVLGSLISDHPVQPVFVTGGPPRTPFTGKGRAHWSNPSFVLHHARSWDSVLSLSAMMPLEMAARPGSPAFERFRSRQHESLSTLASEHPPAVAQIWGPLTLAAASQGVQELLERSHTGSDPSAMIAEGLAASIASARTATSSRIPVLWVAEPLAALIDPRTLARVWVAPMRSLAARAHAKGMDVVVHISGPAAHALPLLEQIGVAGVSITADTQLKAARELLGEQMVVFGNLDSMRLLDKGTPWLAEQARTMVSEMRGRPFVVTPGSAIPDRLDLEPLVAFIDAARAWG